MRKQYNSYRLVRYIFNYSPLNQLSRLLVSINNRRVSIDDSTTEKTIAKTINDIANTANKNVIII